MLIVAVLVGFAAAGQVSAIRAEEAGGRLDLLLAGPVDRVVWLAGRVLIAAAAVVAGGLLGGVAAWVGGLSQGSSVGFAALVVAGLNVAAPALCVIGAGVLAFGVRSRWSAAVAHGVLAWSLLVEVAGGMGTASRWMVDTSLFHQMAAAPAVAVDWRSASSMAAIGLAASVAGAVAFARRDLQVG